MALLDYNYKAIKHANLKLQYFLKIHELHVMQYNSSKGVN